MTALDIIYRARSASDLPSSQFVSHQDEIDSLNEGWKDLYSALTDSDDDYYLTETTLAIGPAQAVVGANNEYVVNLPADFFKLRYLDYNGSGTDWQPVRKFNISMKDNQPGVPYYRVKGSTLWIVGGSVPATGITMRMGYYPVPATLTCPKQPVVYGSSYTGAQFSSLTAPYYAPVNQTVVYANGNVITAESYTLKTITTPVALFTESGAVTNFQYYKGQLYWIRGGSIWYKPTQLAAAFITPVQVGALSGVSCFYIAPNDTIYYATATAIRSCTLTGGSDALVSSVANVTSLARVGTTTVYCTSANLVGTLSPSATMYASGISKVTTDGSGNAMLLILDTSQNVREVTFSPTTGAVVTDTTMDTLVTDLGISSLDYGQAQGGMQSPLSIRPIIYGSYQQIQAEDNAINYNFTFPNNAAFEVMAWRSAVDYRTKQGADITAHLLKLGHPTNAADGPATGLWARFENTIKRDAYQPERIRNAYGSMVWGT